MSGGNEQAVLRFLTLRLFAGVKLNQGRRVQRCRGRCPRCSAWELIFDTAVLHKFVLTPIFELRGPSL